MIPARRSYLAIAVLMLVPSMPLGTAMGWVIAAAGLTVAMVIWFGPETKGTRFE